MLGFLPKWERTDCPRSLHIIQLTLQQADCISCDLIALQTALERDSDAATVVRGNGSGLLHASAKVSCMSVMTYLIKVRARLNTEDALGQTALHHGAKMGHTEVT